MTNYTSYINKKHDRVGHLFQGRFRSVLVDAASYAKELSRYIHLNPVRRGIVDRAEQYGWSSYGYYRGEANPGRWLETAFVLRLFGEQQSKNARKAYIEFVDEGIGKEIGASIRDSIKKGILGSEEFIEKIKRAHLGDALGEPGRDRPQLRRLRIVPDLSRIRNECENRLGSKNRWTVPIAVLLSHRCTGSKLREIGEFYSLSVSGVSSACSRAREAMSKNAVLLRAVRDIEEEICR